MTFSSLRMISGFRKTCPGLRLAASKSLHVSKILPSSPGFLVCQVALNDLAEADELGVGAQDHVDLHAGGQTLLEAAELAAATRLEIDFAVVGVLGALELGVVVVLHGTAEEGSAAEARLGAVVEVLALRLHLAHGAGPRRILIAVVRWCTMPLHNVTDSSILKWQSIFVNCTTNRFPNDLQAPRFMRNRKPESRARFSYCRTGSCTLHQRDPRTLYTMYDATRTFDFRSR